MPRFAIRLSPLALLIAVASVLWLAAPAAGASTVPPGQPITGGNIAHVLSNKQMHQLAGPEFTAPRVEHSHVAGVISLVFGPQGALTIQPGSAGYREFTQGYKPFGKPVHLGQLTGYVQWTGEYNLGVYVDGELIAFQGHTRIAVVDVAGQVLLRLHLK